MKTKTQTKILAAFAILGTFLLSSCVSMTSMQTARTLGKGNTEVAVGGSRVSYEFASSVDTFEAKTVTAVYIDLKIADKHGWDVVKEYADSP